MELVHPKASESRATTRMGVPAPMKAWRPLALCLACRLLLAAAFMPGLNRVCAQTSPTLPPPETVQYKSFENETLSRFAWKGRKVAFLTESKDLDPEAMARLCHTFDQVYGFYQKATGREPARAKHLEGRITVAEVKKTCGAGCGYLGATGIELMPDCFRTLYEGVLRQNVYDQALPYEFGRNFWFYSPQLAYHKDADAGSIVTGYAVFMRFLALDTAGAKLGPFRDRSGDDFRRELQKLVDLYLADPAFRWENTLKIGAAPPNPMGLNGTDLFAAFCFRLCQDHGGATFAEKLWREAGQRPPAKTTPEAIDNFVIAASLAARQDLTQLFQKNWRWPVSDHARQEVARLLAAKKP